VLEKAKSMRFDTRQVRATLDGTMTEVRMPIKPQLKYIQLLNDGRIESSNDGGFDQDVKHIKLPYQPGDIVYVKETWNYFKYNNDYDKKYLSGYYYKASPELVEDMPPLVKGYYGVRWFPSIHMPRAAARIFLRVTSREVERLQDITEEGARAEGTDWEVQKAGGYVNDGYYRSRFLTVLWDGVYKKRGYGWDLNPWVTVTRFERVKN